MKKRKLSFKTLSSSKKSRFVLVAIIAVVGTYLLTSSQAATGDAVLSLRSATGNHTVGRSFTVSVYENSSSSNVNAVNVGLTYDSSKLRPDAVVSSGTFASCPQLSGSGGSIRMICFVTPPNSVSGDKQIGTITFTVLSAGTTNVSFSSDSEISQAGTATNLWNGNTSGGSYTLSVPAPTPTPSPTPTPAPTTPTPSNPSRPSTPSSGTRSSGGSSNSGNSSSGGSAPAASEPTETPNEITSPNQSATQPFLGGIIAVTILDADGKPLSGVEVKLDGKKATTDSSGVASFLGIAPGKYKLEAKGVLGAASKEITVTDTSTSSPVEAQKFALTLKKTFNWPMYLGIAVLLALGIALIVLAKRWLQRRPIKSNHHTSSGIVVNGKDISAPKDEEPAALNFVPVPSPSKPLHEPELKTSKHDVKPTDTLEEIERKVGAKKTPPVENSHAHHSTRPAVAVETIMASPEDKTVKADAKGDSGIMITPTKPPSDPV